MKVSVIVPVYNVADYLKRGIESILSQSFQDFEIILVDDGSIDLSGKICDEYASSDSRIQVIHKDNGGVSSARNAGLDMASGEWAYFMDPDDELVSDALSTLVDGINDDVDVVMGGFEEIDSEGKIVRSMKVQSGEKRNVSRIESLKPIFTPYSDDYCPPAYLGYTWIRLFRMKVIEDFGLRFNESISNREAGLFTVNYLCVSRGTTCCVNKLVYRYFKRPSSATMSLQKSYNETILSSFDSTLLMLQMIKNVCPSGSAIVKRAKEEVMSRYITIMNLMKKTDAKDEMVLDNLRNRCVKELGIPFVIGYYYRADRKNFLSWAGRAMKKTISQPF